MVYHIQYIHIEGNIEDIVKNEGKYKKESTTVASSTVIRHGSFSFCSWIYFKFSANGFVWIYETNCFSN
jgi:hypothetical protein